MPPGRDLALLQPVLDVRPDPRLHAGIQLVEEMDQRDAGAGPIRGQRRLHRRVAGADDHHVLPIVRVSLGEVVPHLRQLLAGDIDVVRRAGVAGGHHHVAGRDRPLPAGHAPGPERELAPFALDPRNLPVLPHVELELGRHATVVLQRFAPGRLVPDRDEGHTPDLQPVGGAEERRVGGVERDGPRDTALVEDRGGQPRLCGGDSGAQAAWASADDRQVEFIVRHPSSGDRVSIAVRPRPPQRPGQEAGSAAHRSATWASGRRNGG